MKTRFKDGKNELRIRLKRTCILQNMQCSFYHEEGAGKKGKSLLSATASADGNTIDVVVLLDRVRKL